MASLLLKLRDSRSKRMVLSSIFERNNAPDIACNPNTKDRVLPVRHNLIIFT